MNPAGIGTPPTYPDTPLQLPPDLQFGVGKAAVGYKKPDYSWQLLLLGVGLGVLLMMLMTKSGGEQ